jgi:oxygen-independent coproporphyrinogen-3 oxidase
MTRQDNPKALKPILCMNFSTTDLVFDPEIIRRFDVNGPRYTSYPTADRFVEAFNAEAARTWLDQRNIGGITKPLSLYFHIPFCNTICYYCACNKIITKDHGRSARYLKYLARELALQSERLEGAHEVLQLHWGGGTPTFLSREEMRQLMAATRQHFTLLPEGEFSIEVDPRKVDAETVALLGELGFNRMSVGVQDFDAVVQRAVNRIQSEVETRAVIEGARANGFKSISIDLIYGLPKQTLAGFERTLDRVLAMDPDRLSVYNYAHLPGLFKPQRRIAEADIPDPDAKLRILALAIQKLTEAGYVFIGMDHFAKPDDELAVAQRQGRLHRNFQGYSTHADCDMLSFGISSISKVGASYFQNVKTLDEYYDRLDVQEIPVFRGIELNADDVLRRTIIQALMCHFELSIESIESAYLIDFKRYFAAERADLQEMQEAGLVRLEDDWITVLPPGRMLVRVISMVFDRYLRADRERKRYSRVI